MLRRLRQGFVASFLGLGLSGVSGCGDTVPLAPSVSGVQPSAGEVSAESDIPPAVDELTPARDDSRTPNPADDGSTLNTDDRTSKTPDAIPITSNEGPAAATTK